MKRKRKKIVKKSLNLLQFLSARICDKFAPIFHLLQQQNHNIKRKRNKNKNKNKNEIVV